MTAKRGGKVCLAVTRRVEESPSTEDTEKKTQGQGERKGPEKKKIRPEIRKEGKDKSCKVVSKVD